MGLKTYVMGFKTYVFVYHVQCLAPGGQKRALDLLKLELHTDACELLCRCWGLNLGPL